MISLSVGMIGLRTVCQFIHPENKIIMKSHIAKLQLSVAIMLVLLIFTNAAEGLTLTKTGNTQVADFGDLINYNYVLKNDDGVNLHDVVFFDDQFGSIAIGDLLMALAGLTPSVIRSMRAICPGH